MNEIFETIKKIAFEIDTAIKTEEVGYSDSENSSGEEQLKLDVQSDLIIEKAFANVASVKALVSEEKEGVLELSPTGKYTVCYDPLDGSSLVNVNLSVGSIFGIYEGELEGKNLIASAYTVYGPRVELVIANRDSKPMLSRAINGKFEEITELSMHEKGRLTASGGTQQNWSKIHRTFINDLFSEGYHLRYSGGMVPDLHQIMIKGGGIFSYPDTSDKPNGKLRQLFEVIPFALVYEQAGGEAIDNKGKRLLELVPSHPHDTSPCFFGSKYEINALRKAYEIKA